MREKYSADPRSGRRGCGDARRVLSAVLLIVFAASFASCARKAQASARAPEGAADAPTGAAASSTATDPSAPRSPQGRAGKAVPALVASMRGFGLGAASAPRMPEDFSLGPLQLRAQADGDEAAIVGVAQAFAEGVAAGKLDEKLLLPEARAALSVLLAPAPVPGAAQASASSTAAGTGGTAGGSSALACRLGAVSIRGDDASLELRMPRTSAEAPRVEGLLSLRKSGETWYVQALALDPPATAALAFSPGAPGNPGAEKNDGD